MQPLTLHLKESGKHSNLIRSIILIVKSNDMIVTMRMSEGFVIYQSDTLDNCF